MFLIAIKTALLLGALPGVCAQYYKIDTRENILKSARTLAFDMMAFYQGNQPGQIPGILPGPPTEGKGDYFWWEGGAMMGTMIDYWHFTGDSTYNQDIMEGMIHQTGPNADYMPPNHTASLGNDDQGFWGMSAMLAAETKFPNPPSDKPQWLALAQAVFNTQADPSRHDHYCNGGMRWQIPLSNGGYNYKNTIANGCFFNLGARLARYTNNATYARYAEDTWNWIYGVNYIDHETWQVYDGGTIEANCTDIHTATFSYNAAILTQGAAFMYNYTDGSDMWRERVEKLLDTLLKNFFPDGVAYEVPCEGAKGSCTTDMLSFKGYVHRWLTVVAQIAPFTADKILPVLRKSAQAAVNQYTGGDTGRRCGFYWSGGEFVDPSVDKTTGAGEQMNVLAAVSSLMVNEPNPPNAPVTDSTGGISPGDPSAGGGRGGGDVTVHKDITTADRAGAGILTFLLLACLLSTCWWMSFEAPKPEDETLPGSGGNKGKSVAEPAGATPKRSITWLGRFADSPKVIGLRS